MTPRPQYLRLAQQCADDLRKLMRQVDPEFHRPLIGSAIAKIETLIEWAASPPVAGTTQKED